ncbi:MAG: hypothetical protein WCD21_38955 [Streptomyces sp.]
MAEWQGLWGILGVVLGAAVAGMNSWITYRRQRAERLEDRQSARRQRREEFELQHLVEVNQLLRSLQERTDDFVTVKFPDPRQGEGEEDELQREAISLRAVDDADAALSAQVGFILDDRVRALVRAASESINDRVYTLDSEAPGRHAKLTERLQGPGPYTGLKEMVRAVNAAYDAISARVRELYTGRGENQGSRLERAV